MKLNFRIKHSTMKWCFGTRLSFWSNEILFNVRDICDLNVSIVSRWNMKWVNGMMMKWIICHFLRSMVTISDHSEFRTINRNPCLRLVLSYILKLHCVFYYLVSTVSWRPTPTRTINTHEINKQWTKTIWVKRKRRISWKI